MNAHRFSISLFLLLMTFGLSAAGRAAEVDSRIRLNTIGYLPAHEKKASIAAPCKNFAVVRVKDGSKALEDEAGAPALNADTGEQLCIADFSALKTPGEYQLDVPGVGRSAAFRIGDDVYREPFRTVMLGMYLWRCGTAVRATHGGQAFEHEACHMQDGFTDVVNGKHERVESLKGWHDAGDYNKYVVNAGVTVGSMLRAWEEFGPQLEKIKLDIPEAGGALPDILDEIKWETDWLLTMQAADGSVYHKLSAKNFCGFVMPEQEKAERYFTPWGSAATADFVAMMAMAARAFKPYDAAYAERCLAAAKKSYEFLKAHPEDVRPNLEGFRTGAYQTRDIDDRLWAAAEMWETTGDAEALKDFEGRAKAMQGRVGVNWDWSDVGNLGMITYLLSRRGGRDESMAGMIRQNAIGAADEMVRKRNEHGYARPLGTFYNWGCNGTVARQVHNLQAAYKLTQKPEYLEASLDALNHLFGRNYYGRSFVTGLGANPPQHPHDRRSGADKAAAPWPGYVVGGANPRATNWNDSQDDFRTNEIAINWNGALIYALAGFVRE